jgi:hypothetical protein
MAFGVRESSFDTILQTPALFVDEVLTKAASAGYQYVLVKAGPGGYPQFEIYATLRRGEQCSPCHPTHFDPMSFKVNGTL